MDKDILTVAEELHSQGTRLLTETGLKELLEKSGKVEIGGSYLYNLLTHPDIDIGIISSKATKEIFGGLVGELAKIHAVLKLKTSDRITHARNDDATRPKGFWIGLTILFENTSWNIDIWYQKPEWYTDRSAELFQALSAITEKQRSAILTIKSELQERGVYGVGQRFQSVDVYDAVLYKDIYTTDGMNTTNVKVQP